MKDNLNLWQLLDIIIKNKVQKHGKKWAMICPFHDEVTPSCSMDPKSGDFHCFSCGRQGRIEEIAFLIDGHGDDKINMPIKDYDPWKEIESQVKQSPPALRLITSIKESFRKDQ